MAEIEDGGLLEALEDGVESGEGSIKLLRRIMPVIQARDAAVANRAKLELLAEIRAYVGAVYPYSGEIHRRYGYLFRFLDAKYQTKEASDG